MTEILPLILALFFASTFLAIVVMAGAYRKIGRERDAWMQGFAHLHENPDDLGGALRIIATNVNEKGGVLRSAAAFLDKSREK